MSPILEHPVYDCPCYIDLCSIDPISDAIEQPQASVTVQSMHPQTLTFSKSLSYEQLAVWLSNHPRFMGADYQEDISKLKGSESYYVHDSI